MRCKRFRRAGCVGWWVWERPVALGRWRSIHVSFENASGSTTVSSRAGANLVGAESPTFELSVRGWVIGLEAHGRCHQNGAVRRAHSSAHVFRLAAALGRGMTSSAYAQYFGRRARSMAPWDAPFVVALLSRSTFAGKRDMTNAAFGSIGVSHVPGDVGPAQQVRMGNGYWRPPPELRGTRISGVLFGEHHLGLWSPASVLPGLWVNPWAETRLEVSLPFATVTADDSGEILSEDASVTPRDVFGLSPYWPNDLE